MNLEIASGGSRPLLRGRLADPARMDSFTELANPRDLGKIFDTPDYAQWKSLRDLPDPATVGLCSAARSRTGALRREDRAGRGFAFEEETDGHHGEKYAWMSAAYPWPPTSTGLQGLRLDGRIVVSSPGAR